MRVGTRHVEEKAKETASWNTSRKEEDPKGKRFFWQFKKSMEVVFRCSKKKQSGVERLYKKDT